MTETRSADQAATGESSSSDDAAATAPPPRSAKQIQADIDAGQKRLADQVDSLSERLAPQSLAGDAIDNVKRVFVEDDGSPKRKPIAIAVGTVAGLLVLRKLFHR